MDRSPYAVWVRRVAAGEFAGFLVPSAVGVGTVLLGVPQLTQSALLVLAGAVEGLVLGLAQASVLAPRLPGLVARRWVGATVAGATVAWVLGMLPSTLGERLLDVPLVVLVPVGAVLAVALLLSIGVAQYAVLRPLVARPHRWVVVNAVAWLAGLGAVFAVMAVAPDGAAWAGVAAVLGGAAMATTMALVTGREVVRLLAPALPAGRADYAPPT